MFCNKCGKKIEDNALFCTFCGARMEQLPPEAQKIPADQETPAESRAEDRGAPVMTEERPQVSAANTSAPAENAVPQDNSVTGGNTEQNAASSVRESVPGASQRWSTEVPMSGAPQAPGKPAKPRKYYTGGQLALCLVTTGVMAMAAGVFAALYFFGL